jgi:hypothetical protein
LGDIAALALLQFRDLLEARGDHDLGFAGLGLLQLL